MGKKAGEPYDIRTEALAQLADSPSMDVPARSAEELLHELHVYQIEMEMRNDELRRAQIALEESRDRYVDLYEFAPVGYLTINRHGMIVKANLTGATLLGVERKKLFNRRFASFVLPEDSERWHNHFLDALQRDGHHNCEMALKNGDDTRFHARLDCLRMEADRASSVRITLSDITERKQKELALQKIAAIVNSTDDAIIGKSLDGIIQSWNSGAERIFGYTDIEAIGKPMQILIPADRLNEETEILLCVSRGEKVNHFETVRRCKDGKLINISATISPIFDITKGTVVGISKIARDITERKRAEQQMRELSAHLQTVREEEKASFAREVHDNLGSTLLALRMETFCLVQKLAADEKMMHLLKHTESMDSLLDNAVKATRRIITDLRPPIPDDHGLLAALEVYADQFHKRTGIECRVVCVQRKYKGCIDCRDCESNLDNALSINLFRIFQETLTNVARHSGASRVDADLYQDAKEVILSISDNGCGLTEGHTIVSSSYGLRGMRERIEQLSGKIKFDSQPGSGFSVTVILPLPAARH